MRVSPVIVSFAAAFLPNGSVAFTPADGCRMEVDPGNTCVTTGGSPICCNDEIKAECHPFGIAKLDSDLICPTCTATGTNGVTQTFKVDADTTLDLNGNDLVCQQSSQTAPLVGVGPRARIINTDTSSSSRMSVTGKNACVSVTSTSEDFELGDNALGQIHFDSCYVTVNGDRARIQNILVETPPGLAAVSLSGDDGVLTNAELQGSGGDILQGINTIVIPDKAPIGVAISGERNQVMDVVVSAFPLSIIVSANLPLGIPANENTVQASQVTDCLIGISINLGAESNQIIGNTISCGECNDEIELPAEWQGIAEFPVAMGDENDMCGSNIWSQNLPLINCMAAFAPSPCVLTDARTDSPSGSPSNSPAGDPSESPSESPAESPADDPSESPSQSPAESPADDPSESPSQSPAESPADPSESPSGSPVESSPTPPTPSPDPACFSAMNSVEVLGKGVIEIDRLELGDMVKVGDGSHFSAVYSLAHKDDTSTTKYNQIFVKGRELPLEITDDHFLLVNGVLAAAKSVVVGDSLHGMAGSPIEVQRLKSVLRKGLYAPLTHDGTVMVSGIATSCYVSLLPSIVPAFLQAFVSHTVLAPLRMPSWLLPVGFGQTESYADGYSDRVVPWLALASRLSTSTLATAVILLLGLPFLWGVAVLESLFSSCTWMYLLVALMGSAVALRVLGKAKLCKQD